MDLNRVVYGAKLQVADTMRELIQQTATILPAKAIEHMASAIQAIEADLSQQPAPQEPVYMEDED